MLNFLKSLFKSDVPNPTSTQSQQAIAHWQAETEASKPVLSPLEALLTKPTLTVKHFNEVFVIHPDNVTYDFYHKQLVSDAIRNEIVEREVKEAQAAHDAWEKATKESREALFATLARAQEFGHISSHVSVRYVETSPNKTRKEFTRQGIDFTCWPDALGFPKADVIANLNAAFDVMAADFKKDGKTLCYREVVADEFRVIVSARIDQPHYSWFSDYENACLM